MNNKNNKIIFTGGGTGGSVSPLINIYRAISKQDGLDFLFIGGKNGVEKEMAEKEGLVYKGIFSGKLRRYFSFKNFIDPLFIFLGFLESIIIIIKEKPDLIISAGSFISVPFVWAGWFFKIPVLLIQLDIRPGLANKIMAGAADKVAVTFEKSLVAYGNKAVWTGVPLEKINNRSQITKDDILSKYGLNKKLPLVLVVGGGTGSVAINNIIKDSIDNLVNVCNVLHITGKGKRVSIEEKNYKQLEFLDHDEMIVAIKMADLVVSRAGIGFISELVNLRKPAIIIPMPDSHQEDNARVLSDSGAAIILEEKALNSNNFVYNIRNILLEDSLQKDLSYKMGIFMKRKGTENIIEIINNILENKADK